MRAAAIAAGVLLLAALAWWLAASAWPAPPAMPRPEEPPPAALAPPEPALSAERNALPPPAAPPRAGSAPSLDPIEPPAEVRGAPSSGRLHVEVSSRDGTPVPAFRYVLVHAGGRRKAETVEGHRLELPLELGRSATLTVEADGFAPSEELPVALTAAEPERRLAVRLAPAALFSGVELAVQTIDREPVTHVEVEASVAPAGEAASPGDFLWRRRARDPEGRYELPQLQPGRTYTLRIRALDEDGEVAPLVPQEETVTFAGGERICLPLELRPGCFLSVTAADTAGLPLGDEVDLRLVRPDGTAPRTRWRARLGGELVERDDGLPGPAAARLADPVPPGRYLLQARIGDGPITELPLDLAAGPEQAVQLRLSR